MDIQCQISPRQTNWALEGTISC